MSESTEPIKSIFRLSLQRQFSDGPWGQMIVGYYTSVREVEAAKVRLMHRPGFRDTPPDCFKVECYRTNVEYDDPMFFNYFPPASEQGSS